MAAIPAGEAEIGSSASEIARFNIPIRYAQREHPQRTIVFETSFAVATRPVTRGEFAHYVEETGNEPAHWCEVFRDGRWTFDETLSWRDPGFGQQEDHPVVSISWFDAKSYLDWLSKKTGQAYRLLSDAEYEYVARGGTATPWFWGESSVDQAEFANGADQSSRGKGVFDLVQTYGAPTHLAPGASGYAFTSPVGALKPNQFGVYDISGNVWEWVEDSFDERVLPTSQAPLRYESDMRAIRGGSFLMEPAFLRSAARQRDHAWHNDRDIGFRVARDL